MDVFIYKAALYCHDCGEAICLELGPENRTGDSDDFPEGPYADGGGEADTPQHCDRCSVFLENPLTAEGLLYVAEQIVEDLAERPDFESTPALDTWAAFYDLDTVTALREALRDEQEG